MILIADSGSTKTDWALVSNGEVTERVTTQGINPYHQDGEAIGAILRNELLPQTAAGTVREIFFYGSGCRPELEPVMRQVLSNCFPQAVTVEAHGDLLGAARALLGRQRGIACILGTGSNSGLYDGSRIVQNTPPLGYVLGDEGSGAVLGIRFLNALFKGFLPSPLASEFLEEQQMTMGDVIARVYRLPLANRWLASVSPFVCSHLYMPEVRQLVIEHFRQFFSRNLVQYGDRSLPVSAVGSIAWHYRELLAEAAGLEGFVLGTVQHSPIDGMVAYHTK